VCQPRKSWEQEFKQVERWDKKDETKDGEERSRLRDEDSEAGTSKPEGSRGNKGRAEEEELLQLRTAQSRQ
jgi:hypothetical protein